MSSLLSIRQFLRDMRSQKLRTMMTLFGITWGTISIILLMAFGTGMQEDQELRIRGLGDNITVFWGSLTSKPWQGLPRGRQIFFDEEDVQNIKASVPGIKSVSPEYPTNRTMIKSPYNNMIVRTMGVWPEFNEMRNILPRDGGRFINDMDMAKRRRTIFIGDYLAEKLFPGQDPVGQTLLVRGLPFVVVGIMIPKEQSGSYGGRDSRNAYIPSSTLRAMLSVQHPNNIVVQANTLDEMSAVIAGVYRYMANKYNFDPEDTEALSTWDITEDLRFIHVFFTAFRLFLVGIGCLTLVTGGIGVANIMNVVLEERTKEIGIKMALGAKRRTIIAQFMFETTLLVGLGGFIGFAVAMGIIKAYPMLNEMANLSEYLGTPTMQTQESIAAVIILGAVAFMAGFFPARRAAGLEPVKALKLM